MTPLNTEERRSSFFLFLFFLTITVVVVAVAAFFGLQVPSDQNKLMKQQITIYKANDDTLQKFARKVSETVADLDYISKAGAENADFTDDKVSGNLDMLGKQYGVDTTSIRGKMFFNVIKSLLSLQAAEKTLRKNGDNQKTIDDLNTKLLNETTLAEGLQRDNDDLRSHQK